MVVVPSKEQEDHSRKTGGVTPEWPSWSRKPMKPSNTAVEKSVASQTIVSNFADDDTSDDDSSEETSCVDGEAWCGGTDGDDLPCFSCFCEGRGGSQ